MKIKSFLILTCFFCHCQAHVAAQRALPFSAVRRQVDKSQQGGVSEGGNTGDQAAGAASQNPQAGQDKPSQQDTSQQYPQQKQPTANPQENIPAPQDTTPKDLQESHAAGGQGTSQDNTGHQVQGGQPQNEQTAEKSTNTQQHSGSQDSISLDQEQGLRQDSAGSETLPISKPTAPQQNLVVTQSPKLQQNQQYNAENVHSQSQDLEPHNHQTGAQLGQDRQSQNQDPQGQRTQTRGAQTRVLENQGLQSQVRYTQAQETLDPLRQGQQQSSGPNTGNQAEGQGTRTRGQQTQAIAQGLPTRTQDSSNSPEITGGVKQFQQDRSQHVESRLGSNPTNSKLDDWENVRSSDHARTLGTQPDNPITTAGESRSREVFNPSIIPTQVVGGNDRGSAFPQQTLSSANDGQSHGGQGQSPTPTENRATSGTQQLTSESGNEASPTGSTIPHWGQCGGSYNGGASGQCAEGSQCICKDSSRSLSSVFFYQ